MPEEGKEDPLYEPKRWLIGSGILLFGFFVSAGIAYSLKSLVGVGIMGIGIFLTVLIGSDMFSGTTRLDTGEVRKAIAISFVSVYFAMMGISCTGNQDNVLFKNLLENFWGIIAVIIGFYFGGRSAEIIADKFKESPEESNPPQSNHEPPNPAPLAVQEDSEPF
ncbi:MAG: hypothetical protein FJ150_06030 [Euryarchaeota archaeon]|nr:hypothetical protein [Euryarchaeota archaeon]